MSTRKLTEAERQFRLAQAKRRWDFMAGREPARRLEKREREETQRQYNLEHEALMAETKKLLAEAEKREPPTEPDYEGLDPVVAFLARRVTELILQHGNAPQAFRQARIDLVASDLPLDPGMRRQIADELTCLYKFERPDPDGLKKWQLSHAREHQDYLTNFIAMTTTEAEHIAAEKIDLEVGALRKQRQRARKRKQVPR